MENQAVRGFMRGCMFASRSMQAKCIVRVQGQEEIAEDSWCSTNACACSRILGLFRFPDKRSNLPSYEYTDNCIDTRIHQQKGAHHLCGVRDCGKLVFTGVSWKHFNSFWGVDSAVVGLYFCAFCLVDLIFLCIVDSKHAFGPKRLFAVRLEFSLIHKRLWSYRCPPKWNLPRCLRFSSSCLSHRTDIRLIYPLHLVDYPTNVGPCVPRRNPVWWPTNITLGNYRQIHRCTCLLQKDCHD